MTLVVGMVVILVVAAVVLEPIVRGRWADLERTNDEMSEAESVRRVRLLALRDAEYDYEMGKLNEADYRELRGELAAEALEAMKAVEAEASGPPAGATPDEGAIEAEIARVRAGLRDGTTCGACGHLSPVGSRFCAACGETLAVSDSAPA